MAIGSGAHHIARGKETPSRPVAVAEAPTEDWSTITFGYLRQMAQLYNKLLSQTNELDAARIAKEMESVNEAYIQQIGGVDEAMTWDEFISVRPDLKQRLNEYDLNVTRVMDDYL